MASEFPKHFAIKLSKATKLPSITDHDLQALEKSALYNVATENAYIFGTSAKHANGILFKIQKNEIVAKFDFSRKPTWMKIFTSGRIICGTPSLQPYPSVQILEPNLKTMHEFKAPNYITEDASGNIQFYHT